MTFRRVDNPDAETCYLLADPDHVAFDYTRMMIAALLVQPRPGRILVIGMGGGTLGRAFASLLPDARIDNVEIDPAVVRVANDYFGFQATERLRVHIADGRDFVRQAIQRGERYDLVMLDAFDDTYIPAHLITREFLLMVREVLAPDGVLAGNTAGTSALSERERMTYASVFGDLLEFPAHNRIIMATRGDLPSDGELKHNARLWGEPLQARGIDTDIFFERLSRVAARSTVNESKLPRWLTDANAAEALSVMQALPASRESVSGSAKSN